MPAAKLDPLVPHRVSTMARPADAPVNLARLEAISAVGFGHGEGPSGVLDKPRWVSRHANRVADSASERYGTVGMAAMSPDSAPGGL